MNSYHIKTLNKTITEKGDELFIDETNINDIPRAEFIGIKKAEVKEIFNLWKYDLDGDPDAVFSTLYPFKSHIYNPITSITGAEALLRELYINGECFHPDEDAHDLEFDESFPTVEQCDDLNNRMAEMHQLGDFDPAAYILQLQNEFK